MSTINPQAVPPQEPTTPAAPAQQTPSSPSAATPQTTGTMGPISSLADLQKQAPEVYQMTLMSIAWNMCDDQNRSQERIKEINREAERDG